MAKPLLLGVTATPDRGDGVTLEGAFQKIVFELGMIDLINRRQLVDITALQVALKGADYASLHSRAGDIIESEAGEMLLQANAPAHAAAAYRQHAAGRTALIFTPTVATAEAMAAAFNAAGVPAAMLSGATPLEERRHILQALRLGELRAVANCAVLTEGFDEPRVDCVIVARPTKSRALYTQMIGRGTRLYPGKADCLVIDLVGATMRHDLLTTAELFGLPPKEIAARGVAAVAEEQAREQAEAAAAGEIIAARVSLFRERRANWLPIADGRFVLPLGTAGVIALEPLFGDKWRAVLIDPDRRRRVLIDGTDLGYAQGIAEHESKLAGAFHLADREARWRFEPATRKQLWKLKMMKVPTKGIDTKGAAADAITAAMLAEVA